MPIHTATAALPRCLLYLLAAVMLSGGPCPAQDLRVAPDAAYHTPPFTVECRAKASDKSNFNVFVAQETKASGTHWELYSMIESGRFAVYMPGYSPDNIVSESAMVDGKWHFLAMTFDGRTVTLFVDGKRVMQQAVTRKPGMPTVPGEVVFGRIVEDAMGSGVVSEVRISNTVRPVRPTHRQRLESDSRTVGLWHFDPPDAPAADAADATPTWEPPMQTERSDEETLEIGREAARRVREAPLQRKTLGGAPGKFGKAVSTEQAAVAGLAGKRNPAYHTPPLTVECWVQAADKNSFNIFVAQETKGSANHWEIYSFAGTGAFSLYMPGYTPDTVSSGVDVADGQWHSVAMTFDGQTVELFVDGKRTANQKVTRKPGLGPIPGDLVFARLVEGPLGPCVVDEVRVSKVVREITASPSAPYEPDAHTIGLWHFDTPDILGRFRDHSSLNNSDFSDAPLARPRAVTAATGASGLADPLRAGAEAARRARKQLGLLEPKCVIVFDALGATAQDKRRLLDGVGWFFDPAITFGCSGFAPIVDAATTATVGVLALAGKIEMATALEALKTDTDHRGAGERLGQALRVEPAEGSDDGLLILLGDCHVPANDALVQGALEGLGPRTPRIVGGSHPLDGFLYSEGQVVTDSVLGILLTGEFTAGLGLRDGQGVEGTVASARAAAADAVDAAPAPALVLAFDCAARMQTLAARRAEELQALESAAGSATVFGFYSSGEIGAPSIEETSRGVGVHIATCALSPQ